MKSHTNHVYCYPRDSPPQDDSSPRQETFNIHSSLEKRRRLKPRKAASSLLSQRSIASQERPLYPNKKILKINLNLNTKKLGL